MVDVVLKRGIGQWVFGLLVTVVAGCSDPKVPTGTTGATAQFDGTPTAVDSATPDLPALDVATKPDAGNLDCPGGPGCACTAHAECQTGLCIDDPGNPTGKACARKCVDACPGGYACAPITGSGGDISTICVPKYGHLCDPCATSKDCEALGLKDSACVDKGPDGKFCGVGCAAKADCPSDYDCLAVTTAEGGALKQCVRASGDCACSAAAVQKKLATACFTEVKDGGGKVIGKCAGVRTCEVAGLSACTAPTAQAETCNGKDDDCDGLTDEGSCDDGKPCTEDSCDGKSGCANVSKPTMACDADGSLCTENDACVDGVCKPGKVKDCDDKNPCTADACDPAKGCTQTADDGKPCDADGDACTVGDVCAAVACGKGKLTACDDLNACTKDACDPATGKCTTTALADGSNCDDGTACTQGDGCAAGACTGKKVDCDDKNPCTSDVCDLAKGCSQTADDGKPCDADGNACTVGDVCAAAVCEKGKAVVCDDQNPCTKDACDGSTGKCKFSAVQDGIGCDDGTLCTQKDVCSAGDCVGKPLDCDDKNPCTSETCDAKKGCATSNADGAGCDDDNPCTVGDQCSDGGCKPGKAKTCAAGDVCQTWKCDVTSGKCAVKNKPAGEACDDGSACTTGDACKDEGCVGTVTNCDDGNACTTDTCDVKGGCQHASTTAPCDDGDGCTLADFCTQASCKGGPAKVCLGSNKCVAGLCGMALVPAGTFKMGCVQNDNLCKQDENPQHAPQIDAFYIDTLEVTVEKYKACVDDQKCTATKSGSYYNWGAPGKEQHPINGVTWAQADTYCKWSDPKARLPSEAEWEKAARGGLDSKKFPWGDLSPTCTPGQSNTVVMPMSAPYVYGCGADSTLPVGTGSAKNGYGLFDMAGNVWEWTADWYGSTYYSSSPLLNPSGPSSGSARVLRGDSFDDGGTAELRVSNRQFYAPLVVDYGVGFRCVRSYP